MTNEMWIKSFNDDLIGRCQYLSQIVNETLRISPSIKITSAFKLTENTECGGLPILKDHMFITYIYGLSTNP
jgi:cytochrome P450